MRQTEQVDDPRPVAAALAGLAQPGAIVSLVAKNAAVLAESGVQRMAWYGVRLCTDGWTPAQRPTGGEEQALEVELQASRRDPYRLMSRLFHIIGRRLPGQ